MIIACEQCDTQFQLDDARIPARGARVRCSRCKHVFFVPGHADAEARIESIVEEAREGADGPEAASRAPAPADDLAGEPAAAAAPAAEPRSEEPDEEQWEFDDEVPDGPPAGTPAAAAPPAAPEAPSAMPAATPEAPGATLDPSASVASVAPGDGAPAARGASGLSDTPNFEDLLGALEEDGDSIFAGEPPPAAPETPLASGPAPLAGADAAGGAGAPAGAAVASQAAEPSEATASARPAPGRPARRSGLAIDVGRLGDVGHAAAWVATVLLVAVAIGVLAPAALPGPSRRPAAGQALGALVVADLEGRRVENLHAGPLFVVRGRLSNPDAAPVTAPAGLRVDLVDAEGVALATATAAPEVPEWWLRELSPDALERALARIVRPASPGGGALAAREDRRFLAVFRELPAGAEGLAVREVAAGDPPRGSARASRPPPPASPE